MGSGSFFWRGGVNLGRPIVTNGSFATRTSQITVGLVIESVQAYRIQGCHVCAVCAVRCFVTPTWLALMKESKKVLNSRMQSSN